MTDALSVAQAALIKATEAMTQVSAHERECARRYAETANRTASIEEKMDLLLERANLAQGKADRNQAIFGGIPNAFWTVVLSLVSPALVAAAYYYLSHQH